MKRIVPISLIHEYKWHSIFFLVQQTFCSVGIYMHLV